MKVIATRDDAEKKEYELVELCEGKPTKFRTKFSVSYTDEKVCFHFVNSYMGALNCPYAGENEPVWRGDTVEVFISPFGKENEYFEFDVAPNLSYYYCHILNPDGKTAYNHVIDDEPSAETMVKDGVWEAIIEVPFEIMLKEKAGDFKKIPWKMNAYRYDAINGEYCALSPTGEENFHIPKAFLELSFE
ncbi:MAG: hypothetical protein E7364_02830 [Clostridiales bacterium]|nr:hypothetical protein [Clostridiales bacterium]